MKILAISHEYPPIGGGGGNACYFLLENFVKAGHEVTLVTANYGQMNRHELKSGFCIIRVNSKRKHKEHSSFYEMLDFLVRAYIVADKLEKKNKFDVCLIFFGIPSGPIGYMLKKKYNLPYFIRFGGGDIPGTQKRFSMLYKLLGPAIKSIWRNAEKLIVNSSGLKERAQRFYDEKQFDVVCNGVDASIFCEGKRKLEGEKNSFNVLFVSRLLERKGMQYVIPQLSELNDKMNGKLRLTIVGDGPYRQILERSVKENGVENIVKFEGQKDKGEVIHYYQNSDVFILPSDWEGMPNVVLEAMASGLPIIMTPCEGSAELIKNNGFIAKRSEFGARIFELYSDDCLRKEMSHVSRERATELFSWEKASEQYINMMSLYQAGRTQ